MSLTQQRPQVTDEDARAQSEWQTALEQRIEDLILDALDTAVQRWDADYAFLYVAGLTYDLERKYKRLVRGEEEPEPVPGRRAVPRVVRTYVMERDMYRCKRCGTHRSLTVDHIVAVANGGTNDPDNLQTLCLSCNCKKGARE